jgi:hypothetical protein
MSKCISRLLRITGPDFCCAAVVYLDKVDFGIQAVAPKLEALKGMYIEKAIRRCKAMGFQVEEVNPYALSNLVPTFGPSKSGYRIVRELGRFDRSSMDQIQP